MAARDGWSIKVETKELTGVEKEGGLSGGTPRDCSMSAAWLEGRPDQEASSAEVREPEAVDQPLRLISAAENVRKRKASRAAGEAV